VSVNIDYSSGNAGAETNNGSLGSIGNVGVGATVAILTAWNFTTKKFWIYNPAISKWNNDVLANQNPATGTGGYSFSGVTGTLFPAFSAISHARLGSPYNSCLMNTQGSFTNSSVVPTGFTAWDSPDTNAGQVGYIFG
jgi:hypothetical protein